MFKFPFGLTVVCAVFTSGTDSGTGLGFVTTGLGAILTFSLSDCPLNAINSTGSVRHFFFRAPVLKNKVA